MIYLTFMERMKNFNHMKISDKIRKKIEEIEPGNTFTYQQFELKNDEYFAGAKAIERFIKNGVIKRLSTGIFYIPQKSIFGDLKPSDEELIKPYLFNKKDERIAYITGTSFYNKIGLTTQIPRVIKIASRDKRIYISTKNVKATPVKSYVDVTNQNFYLLQILDTLKDFKTIQDLNTKSAIMILKTTISKLSIQETKNLMKYAISYPPRVIAFLGAIIEYIDVNVQTDQLKEILNPLTKYKIGINSDILPTSKNWSIK